MAVLVEQEHEEQAHEESAPRQLARVVPSSEQECDDALFSFSGHAGGLTADTEGAIWVSDTLSATIWRVTEDGIATTLVVAPAAVEQGWKRSIRLAAPAGLALSPDGSLFVADSTRHRVCVVSPDGSLRVVAGGANGYRGGPGTEAMFRFPLDVALGPDGTCYVADTANDRIRAISSDGVVTTVAGAGYDYAAGEEH
ncbi:MAG: hypothetical protein ACRDV4_12075 [Acidimicrobiales bacterium]